VALLVAFGGALGWGFAALPRFGAAVEPYGQRLDRIVPRERRTVNVVGAVIFDVRGFDTLGEELVLFAAVSGCALVLRHLPEREHRGGTSTGREYLTGRDVSRATRLLAVLLLWWSVLVGTEMLLHPHTAPGGGFQAGVALTGGLLAIFASRPDKLAKLAPGPLLEAIEAVALGAFLALALSGIAFGHGFLANFLPLGRWDTLLSGGTIAPLSTATGLAVAAGILLLADEFARSRRDGDDEAKT